MVYLVFVLLEETNNHFICRYVSCGSERGNAFGLAAVCGVSFPFLYFAQMYVPSSPTTNTAYFLTVILVGEFVLSSRL